MQLFPVESPIDCPSLTKRDDHPVPRQGIIQPSTPPAISTNKFYANLMLGNRNQAAWLHPFSVWCTQAEESSETWGLNVAHTEAEQRVFGPDPNADPVQYYFNPIGIQSFRFSAVELSTSEAEMGIIEPQHMSVQLRLGLRNNLEQQNITFSLIQGSGFISAVYSNLTLRLESKVSFRSFEPVKTSHHIHGFRFQLEDGSLWLLYAMPFSTHGHPNLCQVNQTRLETDLPFNGLVQLTKIPRGCSNFEELAHKCAGTWATSTNLTASFGPRSPHSARYDFQFCLHPKSLSKHLLMYALPHHIQSFTKHMGPHIQSGAKMQSTTKGVMTAVVADCWQLEEPSIPQAIDFSMHKEKHLDDATKQIILSVAREEAQGDPLAESNLDSMYFSGKALDKYACLCWVVCALLHDRHLAESLLHKLKQAFARFANNQQRFPLVYESAWGGVVSSAMYETGDLLQDFGNGCYNDHHFHYGYFIHTAALIAHMDELLGHGCHWLDSNRAYVGLLVRDTANANPSDPYFPLSRAFDWFHGHSWAKGLFESWDSKDEESTSEDAYFSYGLKLWGIVTKDHGLEQRANLMLAIQQRVFRNYFLMEDANQNQPAQFVKNKVTGILFENKCDHTTYFGNDIRFIQGIHMIPVSPISVYIRSPRFIREEWNRYFPEDSQTGDDGWKGILYSNYALIEPSKAWNFFASSNFKRTWLDGGATRTWYLALCALLRG